jgi:DNA-directed RNA polymerase subunit L
MLQTISKLASKFSKSIEQKHLHKSQAEERRKYIAQVVERMVDDIDPRLRSISGYQKVLSPCVERLISYAEVVCSRLPGPVEFSRQTFRNNPSVRALFANHKKMAEVFSRCKAVQEFFRANPSADLAYVVLGMRMNEARVFGMEQQGEIIKREVLQKNLSFDDYRITHPSRDEPALRFNLRERAIHECVAQTINQLIASQIYNDELEEHELKLKMQLSMLENQEEGLSTLMHDDQALLHRIHDIREKLEKIEHKQHELSKDTGTLDAFLKKAASLLEQPADLIDVAAISVCVDRLNRVIEDPDSTDEDRIELAQVTFSGEEKRVGLLAAFPRNELVLENKKPVYSL